MVVHLTREILLQVLCVVWLARALAVRNGEKVRVARRIFVMPVGSGIHGRKLRKRVLPPDENEITGHRRLQKHPPTNAILPTRD